MGTGIRHPHHDHRRGSGVRGPHGRVPPPHGFGKVLNPCVDCKILMLRRAKKLLPVYGASYIISGEVLGQRPMSQRADTLNIIRNDADVREVLLRPLSAGLLPVTPWRNQDLIDRAKPALPGRPRTQRTIRPGQGAGRGQDPYPGRWMPHLGERESARRYWPIMRTFPKPLAPYFDLANVGRQLWRREADTVTGHWMVMGRDYRDNQKLLKLVSPEQ